VTATPGRGLRALLAGLIDYAGLFPPTSLAMADAVSNYARYRRGRHAWMLGRFILPRVRLDEFVAHARAAQPWRLSVLASDDLAADGVAIAAFNVRHRESATAGAAGTGACIDTIEVKAATAEEVRRIDTALPRALRVWFEIAPESAVEETIAAIAAAGERAGVKLRTGGVTPDAIPTATTVARVLLACARAGVMWKATAGLHHPLHGSHRLTYTADSPTAPMHGFINVFLAAVLARDLVSRGAPEAESLATLVALLDEQDVREIVWRDDQVTWRGLSLDADAIAATRATFAASFGSCSFEEPVDDLARLGWM
jgi:hypothetical protein